MELHTIEAVAVSFFPRILARFLLSAIVGIGIASFAKNFDRQKMNTGLNISHFRKTYLLPMLFIATVLHLAYNLSIGSPGVLVVFILIVLIFGIIYESEFFALYAFFENNHEKKLQSLKLYVLKKR